jgi:hypothetical protein
MSLTNTTITGTVAFHYAPVMVFFAVFLSACRSQIHPTIFTIYKVDSRGQVFTTSVLEIRFLIFQSFAVVFVANFVAFAFQ